jgi:hypothetical protein
VCKIRTAFTRVIFRTSRVGGIRNNFSGFVGGSGLEKSASDPIGFAFFEPLAVSASGMNRPWRLSDGKVCRGHFKSTNDEAME